MQYKSLFLWQEVYEVSNVCNMIMNMSLRKLKLTFWIQYYQFKKIKPEASARWNFVYRGKKILKCWILRNLPQENNNTTLRKIILQKKLPWAILNEVSNLRVLTPYNTLFIWPILLCRNNHFCLLDLFSMKQKLQSWRKGKKQNYIFVTE